MLDLLAYWFVTLPPAGLVAFVLLVFFLGWLAGFAGYARARLDAYRDFVAANQRRRLSMIEARQ